MPAGSTTMLNENHYIHLTPPVRAPKLSIEPSAIKKWKMSSRQSPVFSRVLQKEDCGSSKIGSGPLAAAGIPDRQLMTELTFIQNHIIKNVFLTGDYPVSSEAGSRHSARKGLRSFSVRYQDTDACRENAQRSTRPSRSTSGFDGLYTIRIIDLFSFMGVKGHGQISFSRQTSQD